MFWEDKCKHEWKVLSKEITESHMEQLDRLRYELNGRMTAPLVKKKIIQIIACEKCGKLKHFVDEF